MAEQTRQGEDWSAIELDAIIADYFAMLGDDLAQVPYVKAYHRVALMQRTGRSAASVEFKHRNISSVLKELGPPWMWGYKPAPNYQEALFEAADRYLTGNREIVELQSTAPSITVPVPEEVFTDMPTTGQSPRRRTLERLVRKFDPVERDFRNRQVGRAGEAFVVDIERRRLVAQDPGDLAGKIRWVATQTPNPQCLIRRGHLEH